MSSSDEYGVEDDDTEFLAAATQIEASQHVDFAASPRPTKRRRISRARQLDGADSDESDGVEDEEQGSSPVVTSRHFTATAPTQAEGDDTGHEEDGSGYYFPEELQEGEDQAPKQSKYKIHIPKNGDLLHDMVFTQTQANLDEDPAAIRGAVWKKPRPPPPLFNAPSNAAARPISNAGPSTTSAAKQPRLGGSLDAFIQRSAPPPKPAESDEAMALRLQAEEYARNARIQAASKPRQPIARHMSEVVDFTQDLEDLPSDAFSSSAGERSPNKEVIELSSQIGTTQRPANGGLRGPQAGLKQMTIFGQPATQAMSASQAATKKHAWPLQDREEAATHHKLDSEAMKTWVYPTNLGTVREYQFNIVSRSLFHNTLVALPTGLGKTFIAATVMLNYYRWTDAQIIFMAPTKPLIAQQMEACYGIAGIRRDDTVLMTGETTPGIRAEEWLEKRAFFMTPQTVINDLKTGICDPKKIVLLVVDEAHKATGGYAYTEVVAFMRRFNPSFRVLALTATPGSSVEAVQSIIDNLGIARVEVRTEQSLDIRQYTHEKHTEKEVFDWSDEQNLIMDHISKALQPVLDKLNSQNAYWSKDPMLLTAFGLTQARKKWMMSEAGRKAPQGLKGMVNTIFTVLSQIAHSISLLKFHGITPFYSSALEFQKNVESGQTKSKYATQITQHEDWVKAMGYMRRWSNSPDFIGHPKLEYLREVVLNHFLDAGEGGGRQGGDVPTRPTRIMVFSGFRDSTQDICRVLKRNEPMIRPHEFVGQASSKSSEGMNQKKQNQVIQDFKAGKFNTLVATSIGEEGLDIGDVDLIVCYDASASPVRMLQRIGRTGRKRIGRVVLLLMRGKEDNDYAKAQDNYTYIQKTIADDSKYNYRDDQSPRILPKDVKPVVDKRIIDIPTENTQPVDLNERNRKRRGKGKVKRPPKKFHMPDNVRTGFVTASRMDSDQEDEEDKPAPKKRAAPAKKKTPKKRPLSPAPEPAQIPFLDDVLLTAEQERELERKYAQTSDNAQNAVIHAPDPSAIPDSLRSLGGHKYVGHGRAALAVSKAMQAVRDIPPDQERIVKMKDLFNKKDLDDITGVRARLVSPEPTAAQVSEDDLPEAPPAARSAPKAKKPRARPAPKKKAPAQRADHYGSDAMEGAESSPEPTPANMRIGTQGIDLGSDDTSGEEDEEEPDSELEAFVARSDDPIEMLSSSLPDTQQRPVTKKGGRLKTRAKPMPILMESDDEDEDSDETSKGSRAVVDLEKDEDGVVEVSDMDDDDAPAAGRAKKRRIVRDSDSDE
jgi:ATP-dependent DNA helicase MPH1